MTRLLQRIQNTARKRSDNYLIEGKTKYLEKQVLMLLLRLQMLSVYKPFDVVSEKCTLNRGE